MRKALRSVVESVDDFGGGRCGKHPWVSLGKWSTNGGKNGGFSTWIPEVTIDLLFTYYVDLGSINGGFSTSSLVYLRVPDDELTKSEEIAKQNGGHYPRWWEFGLATIWFWHDLTIYTIDNGRCADRWYCFQRPCESWGNDSWPNTWDSVFSVHCPTIDRVLKHLWSKSGTRRIRGECKKSTICMVLRLGVLN